MLDDMRYLQFDPFGEPGGQSLKDIAPGSSRVERIGVGAFWTLVAAIVAARAAYFDAGLGDHLRFVASLAHAAWSALV